MSCEYFPDIEECLLNVLQIFHSSTRVALTCMGVAEPYPLNIYHTFKKILQQFQSSTRVALTCMGAVTNNPLLSTTAPFRQVISVLLWKITNKKSESFSKIFVRRSLLYFQNLPN